MKRRICILIIGLLSFSLVQAQDISKETLRWTASGFRDLDSKEDFNNSCEFVTYGRKQVKWVQDDGKNVVDWNITGVSGSWSDVNKSGTIKYNIANSKTKGTVTIAKVPQGWKIDLIVTGGTSDIRLSYQVSSVEKL